MEKNLEYYRALPYTRRAEALYEGDGPPYWVAWVEELQGCKTDGQTSLDAMANLDNAFDEYVEAMLEFGSEVPIPSRIPEAATGVPTWTPDVPLEGEAVIRFALSNDDTSETTPQRKINVRPPVAQGGGWTPEEEIESSTGSNYAQAAG